MSRSSIEKIKCPQCGKEQDFTVWESINTVLDPELKGCVRNKTVFEFKCEECKYSANVDYGFLYHQMEDKMMIYYVQDEKGYETARKSFSGETMPELILDAREQYLYRIVTSQNRLLEKLTIFDEGLDDRAIEIIKVMYIAEAEKEKIEFDEVLFDISASGEKQIIFLDGKQYIAYVGIADEVYRAVMQAYISKMPDIRKDTFEIDTEWAKNILLW